MDPLDHVANRVSIAATIGLLFGASLGLHRGHSSVMRTALLTAGSWAMVGTSCFGVERLSHVLFERLLLYEQQKKLGGYNTRNDHNNNNLEHRISSRTANSLLMASHTFGGIAGGGIIGYLYLRRPLRGMFLFIPVMVGVGFAEIKFEEFRQKRLSLANMPQQEAEGVSDE